MPERIQLSRRKGWRKPENTVVVARPSKWGNPFRLGVTQVRMPGIKPGVEWEHEGRLHKASGDRHPYFHPGGLITFHQVDDASVEQVVELFRRMLANGGYWKPGPTIDDIRRELAGKNLACWCPLDQPCHADVLLELANGPVDGTR